MKFGVIASSPTNMQPVLNMVAENAARLCEATDANIVASMVTDAACSPLWGDAGSYVILNSDSLREVRGQGYSGPGTDPYT